jgi:hypothetical protein
MKILVLYRRQFRFRLDFKAALVLERLAECFLWIGSNVASLGAMRGYLKPFCFFATLGTQMDFKQDGA